MAAQARLLVDAGEAIWTLFGAESLPLFLLALRLGCFDSSQYFRIPEHKTSLTYGHCETGARGLKPGRVQQRSGQDAKLREKGNATESSRKDILLLGSTFYAHLLCEWSCSCRMVMHALCLVLGQRAKRKRGASKHV